MVIRWISNSRRATQRLAFCKPLVALAVGARTRGDMTELLRSVVGKPFEVCDGAAPMLDWGRSIRLLTEGENGTNLIQAQGYYLYKYVARSGWLSPKGVEEYVEVLPRRLSLLDDVFRPTETGQILKDILVPSSEEQSWDAPNDSINPFVLTSEQQYFLGHALVTADGDFLIPWMASIASRFERDRFSYLEAGEAIPGILGSLLDPFASAAYLDSDRRQLIAIESTKARVEQEIERHIEKEGSGSRRDQIAVPRLEWLVDLGLVVREKPDDLLYKFTPVGLAIARQLNEAYTAALQSSSADDALKSVLDNNFATIYGQTLGLKRAELKPDELVEYLMPAYKAINSISGFCLLRPLNVLAAICSMRSGVGIAVEYATAASLIEQRYQMDPHSIDYTIDRLSTDYQVKLAGGRF